MIVKIMKPAGSNFPGVQYNDKKIGNGKGELMIMKNFPSFVDSSDKSNVKNYLSSVSKSNKVKKPQFHAAISTKFREHSKEELTKIAENFMDEMGYGNQPFIVVFHNDTENNHVHIVSTRVDKTTGRKIDDSFEKLKSQKALSKTMEKLYGINAEKQVEQLLGYHYGSLRQLELLLERNGFRLTQNKNKENNLEILKNGVVIKRINGTQITFNSKKNDERSKQIKAIISKYKNIYSNKVFKIEDRRKQEGMLPKDKQIPNEEMLPIIEYESEIQKKLRDVFGFDIVFHQAEGKEPFGYSLIDNKTGTVYKGSDIVKMKDLFEFTSEKIDKRMFESLKDYNISDEKSKRIVLKHLESKNLEKTPKDFMLFQNKKTKNRETLNLIRNDVKDYVKNQNNADVKIITSDDGKHYVIHERLHYVGELKTIIGEKQYLEFLNPHFESGIDNKNDVLKNELSKNIKEMLFELSKSSGGGKDPMEEENKKRKKRKKR